MNLDDLKTTWEQEKIETTPEISLQKQKEIHLPLEKIRKNMKLEFWMTIISFPIILLGMPFISNNPINIMMILILFGVSFYYYLRFYTFYKKINAQNFKTYHNLLDLRYELVLNTELYKSFYLSAIIITIFVITIPFSKGSIILLISTLLITITLMYFFGKLWLHEMYGKHIQQISKLVAELNDEEDDFQYDRSFIKVKNRLAFLNQFQGYCQNTFGKYGNLIYGISVGFIFMLLLLLISFSTGYFIGYFGAKYHWFDLHDIENIKNSL